MASTKFTEIIQGHSIVSDVSVDSIYVTYNPS